MVKKLLVLTILLSAGAVRAEENSERVLTLQEISKLDSALKWSMALRKRSELLIKGKSTPIDAEKMLGVPTSKSKDGNTWFYGDIFWAPYLAIDFSDGHFSEVRFDCKCY